MSLTGTGGGSGSYNRGVSLAFSFVDSGSGTLSVLGTGSASGAGHYNQGVWMQGGRLDSGSSLSLTGLGGTGGSYNHGVQLVSAALEASGVLGVTGTASASTLGMQNMGVQAFGIATLNGGAGSFVTGTGGGGSSANHGVFLNLSGLTTTLAEGDVSGTAGGGASLDRAGTFFPVP